jgi:hypothetical protein
MPVNTQHPDYIKYSPRWQTVRDCVEGDDEIKAKGEAYLPRLYGQEDGEYKAYKNRAVFFDGTSRTAEAYHGLIFAKDPVQTGDISNSFKEFLKDIDASGTGVDQFASNVAWDAMQTGWGGLLVDHTPVEPNSSQLEGSGRAFIKWYSAESVIYWQYSIVNGVKILSKVILREDEEKENSNDEFQTTRTEAYRVLSFDDKGNYIQRVFKKNNNNDSKDVFISSEPIYPRINGKKLKQIPFFTCPGEKPEKSMLLGLAKENIGHYQDMAGYKNGKFFTSFPTPVVENMKTPVIKHKVGEKEVEEVQKVHLGGTQFLFFHQTDGDGNTSPHVNVKFLEYIGAGLSECRLALNDDLDRMAKIGIQNLGSEKKSAETAETAQIRHSSENGVLGAFARNMSDKLTQAVRFEMIWNGISEDEANAWSIELTSNFDVVAASAQIFAIMHAARQSGEIPRSVWFSALKKAGYVPENMSFEEFIKELDADLTGGHGPDGNTNENI